MKKYRVVTIISFLYIVIFITETIIINTLSIPYQTEKILSTIFNGTSILLYCLVFVYFFLGFNNNSENKIKLYPLILILIWTIIAQTTNLYPISSIKNHLGLGKDQAIILGITLYLIRKLFFLIGLISFGNQLRKIKTYKKIGQILITFSILQTLTPMIKPYLGENFFPERNIISLILTFILIYVIPLIIPLSIGLTTIRKLSITHR